MRLSAAAKKKPRIEIIPMIDTMFFLLVFFMIATLSMTLQKGIPVNLPAAESAVRDIPDQITLTLTSEGTLYFNKTLITLDALEVRLSNLRSSESSSSLLINADEQIPHGQVLHLMDLVRLSGITKVGIATKPSELE